MKFKQIDWSAISPEAQAFRELAAKHYELLKEAQQNQMKFCELERKDIAASHANDAKNHRLRMEQAIREACDLILKHNNIGRGANTLDLHGLYTHEAVGAMQDFIDFKKEGVSKVLVLITSQGPHSLNGPRLRPAVINHLISHQFNVIHVFKLTNTMTAVYSYNCQCPIKMENRVSYLRDISKAVAPSNLGVDDCQVL